MKLRKIRGGNIEDLQSKKYNIGVGISLGNRWFTPSNIVEEVRWALQYTKKYVVIYVADSIHAINLEVRNKISKEKALRSANRAGDKILKEVKLEIEKNFESIDFIKIQYAKWDDLIDDDYRKKLAYLYSFYGKNDKFKFNIHNLVKSHLSKEGDRFSEEDIHKLGTYIIEEMPEVMCRVGIKGNVYEAYTYPFDGELPKFVEDIQKGIIFPEIKESIMNTEPKVFLEVNL